MVEDNPLTVGLGPHFMPHPHREFYWVVRLSGGLRAPMSSLDEDLDESLDEDLDESLDEGLDEGLDESLNPWRPRPAEIRFDLSELEGGRAKLPRLMREHITRWYRDQAAWLGVAWPASEAYSRYAARPADALAPFDPVPGLVWAGFRTRVIAAVIDILVLVAMAPVVVLVQGVYGPYTPEGAWASISWVIAWLLYEPVCWFLFGASAGQLLLGLSIVGAEDGRRLDWARVALRWLVWLVGVPAALVGIVRVGSHLDPEGLDPRPRTPWDTAAGSAVVVSADGPSGRQRLAAVVLTAAFLAIPAVVASLVATLHPLFIS
jgi:hypothetical protein